MVDVPSIRAALAAREPLLLDPIEDAGRAAVAAILRTRDDRAEILLIRRAEQPGDPWSGHMAFPGGRAEPSDPSLFETVRRETIEEIGLDVTEHADLLGRLDDVHAIARARRTGMVISPFVFEIRHEPRFIESAEVAEVLWAPLEPMRRGETATLRSYDYEGQRFELPAFDVGGRIVWGLTYRMIRELFDLMARAKGPP
jgi:8-oxo-dGTP pyrophosphatase MutT (NUDIX family)